MAPTLEISELALEGVGPFSTLTKFRFLRGTNVLVSSDAALRRAVVDSIYHTLYPTALALGATVPRTPGAAHARSALTMRARDGRVLRVLRDFDAGATRLLVRKETGEFETLSREAAELTQYLRVELKMPDETMYERILLWSPDSLVTAKGGAKSRRGGYLYGTPSSSRPIAPVAPAMGLATHGGLGRAASGVMAAAQLMPSPAFALTDDAGHHPLQAGPVVGPGLDREKSALGAPTNLPPTPTARDAAAFLSTRDLDNAWPAEALDAEISQKRMHFDRLLSELQLAKRARDARHELDSLVVRRDALGPVVAEQNTLALRVSELEEELATLVDVAQMPDDLPDRLRGLQAAEEKHKSDVARLLEESALAERAYEASHSSRLGQNRFFQIGLVLAFLPFVLAVVVERPSVVFFTLLGAVLAAVAALHHVERLETQGRIRTRIGVLKERGQRLEKQFELETAVPKKLLRELAISDVDAVGERITLHRTRARELDAARQALESFRKDEANARKLAELSDVRAAIERLETAFLGLEATTSASVEDLTARLTRLRAELGAHGIMNLPALPGETTGADARVVVMGARAADEDDDDPEVPRRQGSGDFEKRGAGLASADATYVFSAGGGGEGMGGLPGGLAPSLYGSGTGGSEDEADPSAVFVRSAMELLHLSTDQDLEPIASRLSQYLSILSKGTYKHARFGPWRGLMVRTGDPSTKEVACLDLPDASRLSVEAALRCAVVEQVARLYAIPILIDDPFATLGAAERQVLKKVLRYLEQVTQVVILTPLDDIEGHRLALPAS